MAQSLILLLPVQQKAVASFSSTCHSSLPQRVLPALLTASPFCSERFARKMVILPNAAKGGVLGVEPDLSEDYVEDSEYWTLGEDQEEFFPYGKADGAHSWHEGDDNLDFFEAVGQQIKRAGGPNDHSGQAAISWLYLPVIFTGVAFGVQGEYLFLVCVLFIFAFIGIEMDKPAKPSNFEPEVSRLDRIYESHKDGDDSW